MNAFTIDAALAKQLVAEQFPQWAKLPVRPVAQSGYDNRTFHLGDDMTVRLPSAACYAGQPDKEWQWLPRLAPLLPLPVPVPLAKGAPGCGYPFAWTVCPWLGDTASAARIRDKTRFAADLAGFLLALQAIDCTGGPPAGQHNFYRGGDLAVYDDETRATIAAVAAPLGLAPSRLLRVWDRARASRWDRPPLWLHGDVAIGNLLVRDGRLSAVIDFGVLATGDPASDLVMAWTFFEGDSRRSFMQAFDFTPETWERAAGWALWKALITCRDALGRDADTAAEAARVLVHILQTT